MEQMFWICLCLEIPVPDVDDDEVDDETIEPCDNLLNAASGLSWL